MRALQCNEGVLLYGASKSAALYVYYVVIAAQLVIVECIPRLKWSVSETGRLEIALFAAGNLNQQRFIDVVRVRRVS